MAQKKISPLKAKEYAEDYVRYLKKEHKLPIKSAYLFGSYANGKQRDWSDIDVCVVSPGLKDKKFDILEYLWLKLRKVDVKRGVEPIGIHPDDFVEENPIAYQVKNFGKRLRVS